MAKGVKIETTYSQKNDALLKGTPFFVAHSQEDLNLLDEKHGLDSVARRTIAFINSCYGSNINCDKSLTNLTNFQPNSHFDPKSCTIKIDPMLPQILFAYFIVNSIWENKLYECSQNPNKEECAQQEAIINDTFCKYVTTVYYALIEDQATCNVFKFKYIHDELLNVDKNTVLNVACSYQYASTVFIVAHECAHAIFSMEQRSFKPIEEEEFAADEFAYGVMLKMIEDEIHSNIRVTERELFDYSYLVPFMLSHFNIELVKVFKTITEYNKDKYAELDNRLLKYNTEMAEERLNRLVKCYDLIFEKISFDTEEGNAAYNGYLNVLEIYDNLVNEYQENGKLKDIFDFLKNC